MAGKRTSFILSIAAVAVLAAGGAARAGGGEFTVAQLSGPERQSFVQSSIGSCSATVKQNHPEIPAKTVSTYCTCMANKEADITTQADIDYINQHNAATEEYTRRVQALAPACNAEAGLH